MKKATPFFVLVALSFFLNPFPALERESYMLTGGSVYLVARFGLFVALFLIAHAVRDGRLEQRMAARLAITAWLAIVGLFSDPVGMARMLAPLPVLAIFQWAAPVRIAEDSLLSILPEVARECLAFVFAFAGFGLALTAFGQGPIEASRDVNYFMLAVGIAGFGSGFVIALTDCSRAKFKLLAVLTYGTILVVMTSLLMLEIMHVVPGETQLTLATMALTNVMLIIQVIRHFGRQDLIIKLFETAIGGMIFGGSTQFVIALTYGDSGWLLLFAVIWIPLCLLAIRMAFFGLQLIWSTDNRLGRLWNRAGGASFQ